VGTTGWGARSIDMGELDGKVADARQTLLDHLRTEMVELQFDIIAVLAAAAPFVRISTAMARDTTSRLARSLAVGA